MTLFKNLIFQNDLQEVNEYKTVDIIQENNHFSLSYLILLISSSVIATLGLILNSPAVVIGAMIIAPLVWPLLKISIGITYEKRIILTQALLVLGLSMMIVLLSSYLITLASPIKNLNEEILARANPTFMDLIVALFAGLVIAVAMLQPKISTSLAGVAISTAILPPLCTAGIGLALSNWGLSANAFLLFLANAVSIILITTLVFIVLGVKLDFANKWKKRGLLVLGFAFLLIAIPLLVYLNSFAFRANTISKAEEIIESELESVSSSIEVRDVTAEFPIWSTAAELDLDVDLEIPQDVQISYNQNQTLVEKLESSLEREVKLNLRLFTTVGVSSLEDERNNRTAEEIKRLFLEELAGVDSSITINSIQIDKKDGVWSLNANLASSPNLIFTENQKVLIQNNIKEQTGAEVSLNLNIFPRIQLLDNLPDNSEEKAFKDIQTLSSNFFVNLNSENQVLNLQFDNDKDKLVLNIHLSSPKDFAVSSEMIRDLQTFLEIQPSPEITSLLEGKELKIILRQTQQNIITSD